MPKKTIVLITGKAININLKCVRKKIMEMNVPTLSNTTEMNDDLYCRAKWMSKYGLPWMKQYGRVNDKSIMKFLDCSIDVIDDIKRNMRGYNEQ